MVDARVLIIGCGPTSLIVAYELLRRGINCRLGDKRPAAQSSTRAFTAHDRSVGMCNHMGIAHRVEEVRAVCPGNLFHFRGIDLPVERMPTLDFRRLRNRRHNYARRAVDGLDCDQAFEDLWESVREAHRCNGGEKLIFVLSDLYVDYVRFPLPTSKGCQGTGIGWPSGRWSKRVRSEVGL
jgi:glycine/D-amino acid oxidase-like deaminating enzyme